MNTITKTLLPVFLVASSLASAKEVRVYIASADHGVYTSQLDSQSGALTEPRLVTKMNGAGFLALHPTQKYLYATADVDVKKGGASPLALGPMGLSPRPPGNQLRGNAFVTSAWIPRNINLSPSGKWLLVAGQKSNDLPVFEIDRASGKLSFTSHKITVPKAMCIEFLAR